MQADLTRFRKKAIRQWNKDLPEGGIDRGEAVSRTCVRILNAASQYAVSLWQGSSPTYTPSKELLRDVAWHTAVLSELLGTEDIEFADVTDFAENGLDPEVSTDKTLCAFGIAECASWIMRGYFCDDPVITTGVQEDGEDLSPGEADIAEIFAYLHLIAQQEGKTLSDILV